MWMKNLESLVFEHCVKYSKWCKLA